MDWRSKHQTPGRWNHKTTCKHKKITQLAQDSSSKQRSHVLLYYLLWFAFVTYK